MWSIGVSPERKRLVLLRTGVQLLLDRGRDIVEIIPLLFSNGSAGRKTAVLSGIDDARVRKHESSGTRARYTLVLRLFDGNRLTIDCRSRGDAMDSMRAINRFLSAGARVRASADRIG